MGEDGVGYAGDLQRGFRQVIPRRLDVYLVVGTVFLALIAGYLIPIVGPMLSAGMVGGAFFALAAFLSPRFGFYALLVSSMLGRFEIPFGGASLRPDHLALLPVLGGLVLRLAVESRPGSLRTVRSSNSAVSVAVIVGLALYLAVNLISSFLYAPQPTESYQIVAWLLLSFLAFLAAYSVIGRYVGTREALFAVLAAGFVSAAVGVVLFLLSQFTGSTFGVDRDVDLKLYGTFFEPNIFGSFQAFSTITGVALLHLRQIRGRAFLWVATGTVLSGVALALSFTRAAWLGFFAGLLVLVFFQLRGGRFVLLLSRLGIIVATVLVALVPTGLLENLSARFASIPDIDTGTIAFRLVRFRIALYEWPTSPVLGLGTNSFGQRHLDPSQNNAPDYLPNLFLATLYDIGLVGLLILLLVFGMLVWALVRVTKSGVRESALALALLCGMASLLVSYQGTNAFWFSYNWIVMAIALRFWQTWRRDRTPQLFSSRPKAPRSLRPANSSGDWRR